MFVPAKVIIMKEDKNTPQKPKQSLRPPKVGIGVAEERQGEGETT